MSKLVESNMPSNIRAHVVHLHDGNSTKSQRKGRKYATICKLLDRETGEVIAEGAAYCSAADTPRRCVGRQVAIGRALASLVD